MLELIAGMQGLTVEDGVVVGLAAINRGKCFAERGCHRLWDSWGKKLTSIWTFQNSESRLSRIQLIWSLGGFR